MRQTRALALAAGILVGWALSVGCGPEFDDDLGLPPGKVCYQDSECVPDGCCGQGQNAVHIDDAPDCTGQQCTGSCALKPNLARCGCAIPRCRSGRCTVALSSEPGCG